MESRKETSLAFGERAPLNKREHAGTAFIGLEIYWWSAAAASVGKLEQMDRDVCGNK